ncbi:MAP6 domain-containing protein 1 isoform X2 [Rhea pennata]|uniref:MAP6 domain-containing protein 1 isoform X2 n=1 Tax=Rhea pennata TaxID=8795 RepID=UPI002E26F7E1
MAWPCISRVCCLARFWSQLDKSDLSVPLTIHNYSDIEEQEGGGGPPRGAAAGSPPRAGGRLPAAPRAPAARRGSGDGGARRKGPAGAAGAAAAEPFAAETQYRQDFRAWPVQRRDAFPWIGSGGDCRRNGAAAPGSSVYVLPAGDAEGRPGGSRHSGFPQLWPRSRADGAHTTSYRQEYRPWTGAKPSKPIKTKQGFIIPEEHFVQETSYKADFKAPSRILNV